MDAEYRDVAFRSYPGQLLLYLALCCSFPDSSAAESQALAMIFSPLYTPPPISSYQPKSALRHSSSLFLVQSGTLGCCMPVESRRSWAGCGVQEVVPFFLSFSDKL